VRLKRTSGLVIGALKDRVFQAGVVSIRKRKPPRLRRLQWLREILLMMQPPPPCGDARRGVRPDSHVRPIDDPRVLGI